jgi:imidazolonepropionase-like amidohydrolase
MMLERGTYLVPTLIAPRGVLEARDRGVNVPQYAIDKTTMVLEIHRDSITRAIAAGVPVAMGTDSGVTPHGQNLRELDEMVDCGMSPAQALIATTLTAAELLGVAEDRGVIEDGKRADIVIAQGAAGDINDLRARIRTVIQDGRVVA